MNYNYDWWSYDKNLMRDFNWFLYKVNQRACINLGYIDEEYQSLNRDGKEDYGLGKDVEYFHPTITLDDRMRYIAQNIAQANMSHFNILSNTIISHFYGARGVHQTVTGSDDPNDCFVDFDRIADGDTDLVERHRKIIDYQSKVNKKPIWGTTELHTSIQTGARNYCRQKSANPQREFHPVDVLEWVASFRDNGIGEKLLKTDSMNEAYDILTTQKGIGEYYGFHCSASTSVLPFLKYHHDQRFVAPGPGARYTIQKLWPEAPKKLYDEAIYFLRENSDEIGLTENVEFHEKAYNIDGIFTQEQDSLKYYGTEVLSCQFGIYLQIRNDKKACDRRKVSRIETSQNTLEDFLCGA